jgi:hypothetical protein
MRSVLGDHCVVGKPRRRRGSVLRSRPVADAFGAPVLRDQGPIGRPGTARPMQAPSGGNGELLWPSSVGILFEVLVDRPP